MLEESYTRTICATIAAFTIFAPSLSGNRVAYVNGSTITPGWGVFGIRKIYPTKESGGE